MKPIARASSYYDEAVYICTCDMEQKKTKAIQTENGVVKLYTGLEKNRNHRVAHPNVGVITSVGGNSEFSIGEEIIATHFTFEDVRGINQSFYTEDGVDYFRVENFNVIAGVADGQLTPRKYNLICEATDSKMLETDLHLAGEQDDNRRDVLKITHVWNDCEDYRVGDMVLIEKNGDYYFEYQGKQYIKVDTYFDDVLMKVPNDKWRKEEVHTHNNDHYKMINPMDTNR